jgi:glycosyltransferase involved in cell wall biosynthesis
MAGTLLAVAPVAHPGGAETTLLRTLRELERRGWRATLATPGPGALADLAAAAGHEVVALPIGDIGPRQGARALLSYPRARRLAAQFDAVYLNGTVCGRLLPALGGVARTLLHIHDMVDRVPRIWRRADAVVAASQAVADRLEGLDPVVAYPPVDPDPPAVNPPWSPDGRPVAGYVGRIEPRKGVVDLVAAAPAIAAGGARVVLVGDDDYAIDASYLERVRASTDVEHYGFVEGAAGLMRELDVLVLPSHEEPGGTVLGEAMAVGTPVVATAVDGLPEVVGEGGGGLLVTPGDPTALAAAVLDVLARRDEMGAAAREWARRFHTPAHVDRIEPLLA